MSKITKGTMKGASELARLDTQSQHPKAHIFAIFPQTVIKLKYSVITQNVEQKGYTYWKI
jgi:hypothetical protein